jgi:signal transduction histidine kinase/PAS domain-containing protein
MTSVHHQPEETRLGTHQKQQQAGNTDPSSFVEFLSQHGGEMGALMASLDWPSTLVGPISTWPQSLRTAISICLSSGFPMLILWGDEHVQFYNDAFRPIPGAKHPRSMGQRACDCWAEIWDVIRPMFAQILAGGEAIWFENRPFFLERYGYVEETFFTFSYSPIYDETGKVGGILCTVKETTGQVVSERRLKTLRELATQTSDVHTTEEACQHALAALAAGNADLPFVLLYLLNADGTQAHLMGTTGLASHQLPNQIHLIQDEQSSESATFPFVRAIRTRKPVVEDLSASLGPLVCALGVPTPRQVCLVPIARAGEASLAGLLVVGITPYHAFDEEYRGFFELVAAQIATALANARTHEEEHKRVEALAQLDRAKTAFFNNISHEFRTPLTLSLGPLEALLADHRHPLDTDQRAQIEMVRRNALRQLKLVNTLLDFARIEAGRAEASYQPTDLSQLTADLASAFRSAVEQAGLRLIVDCPPLPEPIRVDRQMWEKIVLNLLSNAFKFTFSGFIRVTLHAVEGGVELVVQDSGVGIREEDLPHLFERFYRAHTPQARTQEGSGIGLALVQELVRLHGGSITVESREGAGTTFTVRLPAGSSHVPPARQEQHSTLTSPALLDNPYVEEALGWLPESRQEAVAAVGPDTSPAPATLLPPAQAETDTSPEHSARLLVVDDNADMRAYLQRLLRPSYQVELAADGKTALTLARETHPDLIISDVLLPGLDGFTLLKELHADPTTARIPVLLLSARAGEEATLEGLAAGAQDYLVKPFSARELLARVAARLDIARLSRESEDRKDEFLRMASHDLRSPLTAMKGNLQLALRLLKRLFSSPDLTEATHRSLEDLSPLIVRALRQTDIQNRLIGDLLDVSRIQTGKLDLDLAPCDLVSLVREIALDHEASAPGRAIRLHMPETEDLIVLADTDRIGQVISNYLSNALKYSATSAPITVGVERVGNDARVWVRDEGPGLTVAQQQRIWERFYQAPGITVQSGAGQGMGLGLHICQTLIKRHNGEVGVESAPGQGSTFWFTLPLLAAEGEE